VLVNALHAAMNAVDQFRALATELHAKGVPLSVTYQHGPTVKADELATQMQTVQHSIFLVLSFIKEMSPQSAEDNSYLFEREWRTISGFGLVGQPPAFRTLTQDEKDRLCAGRPVWRKERQSKDINISSKYGAAPVIDSFQYFNGLPRQETAAQFIDTILVPDATEEHWARTFLSQHASDFGTTIPSVITFPN
jgi:hypothetical protein